MSDRVYAEKAAASATSGHTRGLGSEVQGDALADLAEVALGAEEFDRAIQLFDRAEPHVADPDRCAGGRWMAHMLTGNFAAAWRESDAIRHRGAPDPHRFWLGEDWRGKRLMVRSLHGFGDAVQMFRFLPRLRESAAELTLELAPRLVSLAGCIPGVDRVITWGANAPDVPPLWDVQMEIMELPYALRVRPADLAPAGGYLRLPPGEVIRVRTAMGSGSGQPRIGVVWRAGDWNPARSVPFPLLADLLKVDGVEFWGLQGGEEASLWQGECRGEICGDGILSLAATIASMDLVITVDTLAAHLAGALGVPCWVLLQHRADWRWMSQRTDTPWYSSLRLIRQGAGEDWGATLQRVANLLGAAVQTMDWGVPRAPQETTDEFPFGTRKRSGQQNRKRPRQQHREEPVS